MQTYYLEATGCSSQRPCDPVELSKFGHSANKIRRKKERVQLGYIYIYIRWVQIEINERNKEGEGGTLGQNIATAFWVPKATKSQAPHDTLFTTLLHAAPMNTLLTSAPPFIDMVNQRGDRERLSERSHNC